VGRIKEYHIIDVFLIGNQLMKAVVPESFKASIHTVACEIGMEGLMKRGYCIVGNVGSSVVEAQDNLISFF